MACVVLGCKSHSSRKENETTQISFHRFPEDNIVKQMWIEAISRPNWTWKKHSRICSRHFENDCFVNIHSKWRRLKPNAVPTLRLIPKCVDQVATLSMEIDDEESSYVPMQQQLKGDDNIVAVAGIVDIKTKSAEDEFNVPSTSSGNPGLRKQDTNIETLLLQRKIRQLEQALEKSKKVSKQRLLKINALRQKERRLRNKNTDLNLRLVEFLEGEKVQKENLLMLDCVKNNKVIERYLSKEQGDTTRSFSPELKKFAVTLHFFSPRAYSFVRDELKGILPHPKTISKWYQGVDCNPGFTTESFDSIKQRIKQNDGKPLYCALSMDEMAIRKLVEWNGRDYFGYVNLGCNLDSDDVPLAKEALTFMVTSLNDSWKVPVGYFLIDSITAQQKASLVQQCLALLDNCGVKVVAITFDGAASNKAMCSHLGCDLTETNTFKYNEQTICIWPDPCHNIKLVRNTFADKLVLYDKDGNKIMWQYVELLNFLQNEEKMHLGTKLKNEHIHFIKQKMKVRLATQLLSTSVADALEFCLQLGIPEFEGCSGTINFIRIFNNIFDIMNSRNLRAKGFKKAITYFNYEETVNFFESAEMYINNLKFEDGTFVVRSNRSTGFRGFLLCMKSVIFMYTTLIAPSNSYLKYLPTYKLSQDHLELFFGAIRAQCGFNNNPSARMFRAAYKKLLVHAQFKDGARGNCVPLDNISVLNYTPQKYKTIINETTSASRIIEVPDLPVNDTDHDYILTSSSLSEYAHHVVHYIAGFVARKLRHNLKCEKCIQALETTANNELSLITVKDRGGLIKPSYDVTKICKEAEKILREYEIRLGAKCIGKPQYLLAMINKISQSLLPSNIFSNLSDHSLDNDLTEDHRHLIIKAISQTYLNVRIHYITKQLSAPKEKIRAFLTKTVIFKGQ